MSHCELSRRHPLTTRTWGLAAAAILVPILSAGHAAPARANVISGASDGFGEQVNLTLTPLVTGPTLTINSAAMPTASGTAPSPYSTTNSLLSVSVSGLLSTGTLQAAAASTVNGSTGATSATATVNNLGLSLASLLGISAGTVTSSAALTGAFGALTPVGSTTIQGLSIAGLTPFAASITPTINDVVLNLAGVEVTLNRETTTGDGSSSDAVKVDGIAIDFTNALGTIGTSTGLLNGEVDIAESYATETANATVVAVAEPASWLGLMAGMLGIFAVRRSRSAGASGSVA